MRVMRVGPVGLERPVVPIGGGAAVPIDDLVADIDESFWSRLPEIGETVSERARQGHTVPIGGERIGAPIARPQQILCIGLNYADHALETGQEIPTEPIVFTKAPNCLVGPDDSIRIPKGSVKTDWEVELGVVIGHRARYLPDPESAREVIGGYVLCNDVSEREFQLERGGQWSKGKSSETFNPCGPVLVTADELTDPSDLTMWLDVNGEKRQRGSTRTMVFGVLEIVHYLSQFMVLEPGDLINTGTPPGVGMGMKPPQYLRVGDTVALGIDGLGEQNSTVVDHEGAAGPAEGAA